MTELSAKKAKREPQKYPYFPHNTFDNSTLTLPLVRSPCTFPHYPLYGLRSRGCLLGSLSSASLLGSLPFLVPGPCSRGLLGSSPRAGIDWEIPFLPPSTEAGSKQLMSRARVSTLGPRSFCHPQKLISKVCVPPLPPHTHTQLVSV